MDDNLKAKVIAITDEKELKELSELISARRNEFRRRRSEDIKLCLSVGDTVKIKDEHIKNKSDRLHNVTGKIRKINPSKAKIDFEGQGTWHVPYSMIETV